MSLHSAVFGPAYTALLSILIGDMVKPFGSLDQSITHAMDWNSVLILNTTNRRARCSTTHLSTQAYQDGPCCHQWSHTWQLVSNENFHTQTSADEIEL